ncbi:MAG: GntR family transcriptional regulator [Pseudomonadota bacterium]
MPTLGEEHANLDQKAYQIIKDMIIGRELLPGDKIPQEKLARDLGISRTPLVNALKYLEHEKLVEAKPRRGYFVRLFTIQEMVSIFELREVLEGLAARRAATHITVPQIDRLNTFFSAFSTQSTLADVRAYAREDRAFHNFVVEVSAREFLKSMLETYNIISFSYQVISSEGLVRSPDKTIKEHMNVITAISDRDPEEAERLMRQHFRNSIAELKLQIEKAADGAVPSPRHDAAA